MSIDKSKARLTALIDDQSLRVIALTGPWGTGKTYLWQQQIKKDSADPKIQSSLYVSLFGIKDLNQLKLKIVQSALPVGADSNLLTDGATKAWKTGVEVLKKIHPGFAAVDELAMIAVPATLRDRFVVIDDVERKHSALSIDEILGFVDEYSQRFGTRFLLILNTDELTAAGDDAMWSTFREKVVDEELRFVPEPRESFALAVPEDDAPYRATCLEAVDACGVTNIRVIRKAYRLVLQILGAEPELHPAVQARTVPSLVLIAATHYGAIKDGPTPEFIESFNTDSKQFVERFLNQGDGQDQAASLSPTPAAWKLLMEKLTITSADAFEELVLAYLRDGRHDSDAVKAIVDGYSANHRRLEAQGLAHAFVEYCTWAVSMPYAELLQHANRLVDMAEELDPYTITELYDRIAELAGGQASADALLEKSLEHLRAISETTEFGESPFNQRLHPRLKEAMASAREKRIDDDSLVDAVTFVAEHSGWNRREETLMKAASVDGFMSAMNSLDRRALKIFMLKSLDILEHGETYDKNFGDFRFRFLDACRQVCAVAPQSRLASLIRRLFAESKAAGLLAPPDQAPGSSPDKPGERAGSERD